MIVEASAAHAGVIAAMHAACFEESWSAPEIARLMAMPGAVTLLHVEPSGDGPRGFLIARKAADEAEILTLATLPEARRKGVATLLARSLVQRLAGEGFLSLHIEVAAGNEPALALYRALGFERSGLRRGYYGDEDAVLMRLSLRPPRPRPISAAEARGDR